MANYGVDIAVLTVGQSRCIDARNAAAVVVRAGTGATVTVSAVDDIDAVAHTTGTENQATVAANAFASLFTLLGPWPAFFVSVAGGGCRIGKVI